MPDLKPVAIKVEPGVVQPSASEPWGQQGVGWEWEGQRSGSATSNKEWEWDAGYGSEYGRGQWGYWYSSQNNLINGTGLPRILGQAGMGLGKAPPHPGLKIPGVTSPEQTRLGGKPCGEMQS